METWMRFDSDSELHRRSADTKTKEDMCKFSDSNRDGYTRCKGAEDFRDAAKNNDRLSNVDCCLSLPDTIPRYMASGSMSASCENLDSCSKQTHTRRNDLLPTPGPRLCKASSDNHVFGTAPPIPPRDYHNKSQTRRAEIHPIVMNGEQLTHTHYWLLPDKVERKPENPLIGDEPPESYINVIPPTPRSSDFGLPGSGITGSSSMESLATTSCFGSCKKHPILKPRGADAAPLLSNEADIDAASPDLIYGEDSAVFDGRSLSEKFDYRNDKVDGGGVSMKDVNDLIRKVQELVPGVTFDECYAALSLRSWKVDAASKYLKVEQLFRLGMTNRACCLNLLERYNWNIETAASQLVDQSSVKSLNSYDSSNSPSAVKSIKPADNRSKSSQTKPS